jgi:hypothetical protein
MKNKNTPYYIAWAAMYLLCALLSFLPAPQRSLKGLMTLFSLAFFVPPAILLYRSVKNRAAGTVQLLLWLSVGSLVLTFVLLLLNFLSFGATQAAGSMVYWLLVLVSVPMVCSGAWVLSLFLWALLLMVCLKYRKMEK